MRYQYCLLAVLFSGSMSAFAQNCNEATLLQSPGTFKPGMKGSTSGTAAEHLVIEQKVVASIHNIVKQRYSPKGVDVFYAGAYSRIMPDMAVSPYYYGGYFMPFQCNGNAIKAAGVTNTTVFIQANEPGITYNHNVINAFMDEADENHYGWIGKMPVFKNGYAYSRGEASGGFGAKVKEEKWLITYDDKLPFQYVTRKEYLDKLLYILKKLRDKENSKYYGDLLKDAENVAKHTTASEGSLPAIVPFMGDFKGFLKEGERFAVIVVKRSNAYYNPNISKAIPQIWLVTLNSDTTSSVLNQATKDFVQSFDFAALKNMLGKEPGKEAPAEKTTPALKPAATTNKKTVKAQ